MFYDCIFDCCQLNCACPISCPFIWLTANFVYTHLSSLLDFGKTHWVSRDVLKIKLKQRANTLIWVLHRVTEISLLPLDLSMDICGLGQQKIRCSATKAYQASSFPCSYHERTRVNIIWWNSSSAKQLSLEENCAINISPSLVGLVKHPQPLEISQASL